VKCGCRDGWRIDGPEHAPFESRASRIFARRKKTNHTAAMQTKRFPLRLAFGLLSCSLSVSAQSNSAPAQNPADVTTLDKLVVQAAVTPTANTLAGPQQIRLQPPASSALNVIKYLPGVNLSQGDAIGSDDWSTRLTIRGFNESQLGFTIDGVANGFTGYAGGAKPNRFVDLENLSSVVVSQGAGDISSASRQALGGTLAYFTDAPATTAGGAANFTFGSFNTWRVFARADTGKFAGENRAFIGFSDEQNDNWVSHFVGGSAAITKRLHLDAKEVSELGNTKLTFFAAVDNINPEINYQGVTLQQFAQDPRNDQLTFNWTGNPTIDQNYAPTWTTIRTNSLLYLKAEAPVAENFRVSVQPYWHHNSGRGQFLPPYQVRRYDLAGNLTKLGDYKAPGKPTTIFFADANGADIAPVNPATGAAPADPTDIRTYTWLTAAQQSAARRVSSARFSRYQNNRYGDNLAFTWDVTHDNKVQLGMWNELQERLRHRTWHNVFDPRVSSAFDQGGYLDQFRWSYRTATNLFFAQDQLTMDKLVLTLGAKYFRVHVRSSESLLLPNGNPGYSTSLDSNSKLLPAIGAQYKLDADSELFASYSGNFSAVPDFLLEAGASGVDVSRVKPEKAGNFDFGYRFAAHNLALSATAYYIKYTDKLVQLTGTAAKDYTNASSGVWTNIGGTKSYGVELAANYRLGAGFSALGSLSTTHATYTASTPDGTITAGKRVVDTPDFIASYGLLYGRSGFEAGAIAKYTSKRYGTYSNDNSAAAYTVLDLNAGYTRVFHRGDFIRSLRFGITVANVLDKNYLSNVSINDQGYVKNDATGSTMMWNIGAPRTFMFTAGIGF